MWNRLVIIGTLLLSVLLPCRAQGGSGRLLQFENASIDLGDIPSGKDVSVSFRFANIADAPVSVVDVHAQCGCTVPSFSTSSVKPGKKGTVNVKLLTKGLSGPQKRHLTVITTNGEKRRFSTITIICNITE